MEIKKKNIMNRSYLVAFGLMLFSFLLIAKLIHIQFSEGDKYREIASKRTLKIDILQPSRGNIFADDEVFWLHQWHDTKLDGMPLFLPKQCI